MSESQGPHSGQSPVDYSGHVPTINVHVQQPVYPDAVSASRHHANVKQSRDKAQYVRQQKGHSFIVHWFILGIFTCFIVPVYYSVSPNHYWHI